MEVAHLARQSFTTEIAEDAMRIMEMRVEAVLEFMPVPPGMEEMKDKAEARTRIKQALQSGDRNLAEMVLEAAGGTAAVMNMLTEEASDGTY
jgi:beta-phosphoglucomutase-like phosphatase (HAD superfamily)